MKGKEELIFGIKSGYAYFYCESQEVQKTVEDIKTVLAVYAKQASNGIKYEIKTWDFESTDRKGESQFNNPQEMLKLLEDIKAGTDSVQPGRIVIAKNFQWFLKDEFDKFSKEDVAWLLNRSAKFSSPDYRKILIIVGDTEFNKAIPEPLKRDFAKITFDLPGEEEIEQIYQFIVESAKDNPKFKPIDETEHKRIISAAKGLTASEVVKAYSYSLVKNAGEFKAITVEEKRAEEINQTPGLTIGFYEKKLDDLKGYDIAKEIVDESIYDPKAKGIILLGPAGVGKTHFAQSIAGHYGRLCIEIEIARMQGEGLVGQAENAMAKAMAVCKANANPLAPIVVLIDEIEKGLAGVGGQGVNDGGTTQRSTAQFLKFLSERPDGIYIIATCNNIKQLPPEYIRAERWDTAPLFIDLPNDEEQRAILNHYKAAHEIGVDPANMKDWSGAEIKAWCKLAARKKAHGKPESDADELIVPIATTMMESIDELRRVWKPRCIAATRQKVFNQKASKGRKLEI